MGITDSFLIPVMPQYIAKSINRLPEGAKIAWIGQKHPAMNDTNQMYESIMSFVEVDALEHDFYDIKNDKNIARNSYVWDLNTEWNFKGYDLIVAVRIFYASNSASQLLRNIKKATSNGQMIVGDLMSGNTGEYMDSGLGRKQYYSNIREGNEVFTKPESSKAIIPMLPVIWEKHQVKDALGGYNFAAVQNHTDQILPEGDFEKNDIQVTSVHSFRERAKYRIYTICVFSAANS
jgi:hypothetical protein